MTAYDKKVELLTSFMRIVFLTVTSLDFNVHTHFWNCLDLSHHQTASIEFQKNKKKKDKRSFYLLKQKKTFCCTYLLLEITSQHCMFTL